VCWSVDAAIPMELATISSMPGISIGRPSSTWIADANPVASSSAPGPAMTNSSPLILATVHSSGASAESRRETSTSSASPIS
jgi:hypothetical protein